MRYLFQIAAVALLIVIVLTLVAKWRGDTAHAGPYPAEELREDLAQLRGEMESCHPKLYAFAGKSDFEKAFDDAFKRLARPMSLEEFYGIVKPIVAMIGCGHARVHSPEGYWDRCPGRLFPLELAFVSDGAFAIRSYADTVGVSSIAETRGERAATPSSGGTGSVIADFAPGFIRSEPEPEGVPQGSRILSINGLSMDEIVTKMKAAISADGYNDSSKDYKLNAAFVYLYALLFGYPEEFVVEYAAPGPAAAGGPGETAPGVTETAAPRPGRAALPPVGVEDVEPSPDPRMATGEWTGGDLGFEIIEDRGVAAMTFKTFGYYDRRDTFYAFVDDAFETMDAAGIDKLILDFRGNDGGDPFCTVHLLSYIADRPVTYFGRKYRQYEKFAEPIPLAENRFDGDYVVLIDGGCFSSTGHLCAVLEYNGMGTFVGEETGGTYTCNDASKGFTLKNTGLRINMPRMTFAAAVSGMPDDRGIMPDHEVEPRIEDLIQGRDTVREFALELLE
jgi:hypothetical protein